MGDIVGNETVRGLIAELMKHDPDAKIRIVIEGQGVVSFAERPCNVDPSNPTNASKGFVTIRGFGVNNCPLEKWRG